MSIFNIFYTPDRILNKSIELGFNGKTTPEFFTKWHSTNKVRQRLLLDLFVYISYTIFMIFLTTNVSIWFFPLFLMGGYIIYKNLYIWYDIVKVKNERFKKYMDEYGQKN